MIRERKPHPVREHHDLARQLLQDLTPEAEARIAAATAEAHDIVAALNALAARAARLWASGRQVRATRRSLDIPEDTPRWKPRDGLNLPGEFGGSFFETDVELFFWGELGLEELGEALTTAAADLARDLEEADPANAVTRAAEQLSLLPLPMLDGLRARLAELAAPTGRGGPPKRRMGGGRARRKAGASRRR